MPWKEQQIQNDSMLDYGEYADPENVLRVVLAL